MEEVKLLETIKNFLTQTSKNIINEQKMFDAYLRSDNPSPEILILLMQKIILEPEFKIPNSLFASNRYYEAVEMMYNRDGLLESWFAGDGSRYPSDMRALREKCKLTLCQRKREQELKENIKEKCKLEDEIIRLFSTAKK